MDELIVEWTLVKNKKIVLDSFQSSRFPFEVRDIHLIAEQMSDPDIGKVDLIYETNDHKILIVELETEITDSGKYDFCTSQIQRYFAFIKKYFSGRECRMIILFDKLGTSQSFMSKLEQFSKEKQVLLATYEMSSVEESYKNEIERISQVMGVKIDPPTSDMPYTLSSINRFLMSFKITRKDSLTLAEVARALPVTKGTNVGKPWSLSSVLTHEYVCKGIGAIKIEGVGDRKVYTLTDIGKELIEGMNLLGMDPKDIVSRSNNLELSILQKRVILSCLLNNPEMSKVKAMVFSFLRYIDVTRGELIPKQRDFPFTEGQVDLINRILGTNHVNKTNIGNLLTWSRNYCRELGLIDIIKLEKEKFDKVAFTSIGSRFYHLLDLQQNIKRESIHLTHDVG